MRVVAIAASFVEGGAERYLRNLYAKLGEKGIEAELVGAIPGWVEQCNLPCTALGFGPKWSVRTAPLNLAQLPRELRCALAVARQLNQERAVSLFHLQFKREQILFSRALSQMAPVIWTEHGVLPERGAASAIIGSYRRAARHVSRIICVSETVRDQLRDILGLRAPMLEVIVNGVDTSKFSVPSEQQKTLSRASFDVSPACAVVGYVGRLHKNKDPDLAIDAVQQLNSARLLVAGTGPEAERLRMADNRHVTFLGHVDDPLPVYHAMDVFVFPSRGTGEGLPISLVEAASTGLPIVTVSGSGSEALVEAMGGIVAERNPLGLAAALERALRLPRRRSPLVDALFSQHRWIDEHERVLRSVFSQDRRA